MLRKLVAILYLNCLSTKSPTGWTPGESGVVALSGGATASANREPLCPCRRLASAAVIFFDDWARKRPTNDETNYYRRGLQWEHPSMDIPR